MTARWLLAAAHLLALGIGLGAVWGRSRALRGTLDRRGLSRVFAADAWWGLAAAVWIATGLARLFSGFEKGTDYYLHNWAFHTKMGLFLLILALEAWPMATLIRWRVALGRGETPDTRHARAFAAISVVEAHLVVGIVLAASAMARGMAQLSR
ncbi:MAG TPA: DUF2214 family protein [Gemmatimonadaceae bacterium]|nr:DUF2214 family protein [Gemmatimonadaceae bacterium]